MTTWMAAWTIGAALAAGSQASAEEALTVAVQMVNYAKMPPEDLAHAQAQATAAYRAAGFDVVWSSVSQRPDAGSEGTASRSIDVRVVILSRDMAEKKCRSEGLDDGVMGVAISAATEARSRIAYIFYDRIVRVALSQDTPVDRGLGHVLAHEIGHLLIGVNSHSGDGLMRADWIPSERHVQTFTSGQVRTIRRRFRAGVN